MVNASCHNVSGWLGDAFYPIQCPLTYGTLTDNLLSYSFQVQVTTKCLMGVTTQGFPLLTWRVSIIKPHLHCQLTNVIFHFKWSKFRYNLVIVDGILDYRTVVFHIPTLDQPIVVAVVGNNQFPKSGLLTKGISLLYFIIIKIPIIIIQWIITISKTKDFLSSISQKTKLLSDNHPLGCISTWGCQVSSHKQSEKVMTNCENSMLLLQLWLLGVGRNQCWGVVGSCMAK